MPITSMRYGFIAMPVESFVKQINWSKTINDRCLCLLPESTYVESKFNGEFDPGSGRTLAACFIHASRTMKFLREWISGERVRNT